MNEAIIDDDHTLEHYGIIRRSGRYPWGSGKDPYQRSQRFYQIVDEMRKQGLTDQQIADAFNDPNDPDGKFTVNMLKQTRSMARHEIRAQDRAYAMDLHAKNMSVSAIASQMGKNESTVRSLLDDKIAQRQAVLKNITDAMRTQVDEHKFLDVGKGTEIYAGVTREKLNTAIAVLESEGYKRRWVNADQMGMPGQSTTVLVLMRPDQTFPDLAEDFSQIKIWDHYSHDGGESFNVIKKPRPIDSKGIEVVYGSEGGADKDGLVELRRGVPELDLGHSRYAQVRILVDGTHYIKGMAVPSDDLPPGVNVRVYTPKASTGNKLDVLKPVEPNEDQPFGAEIRRQKTFIDSNGKEQITAVNIINEEGDWRDWNKTLSSQMMSKQEPEVTKRQLAEFRKNRDREFEQIRSLTNPTLRKDQLRQFADKLDSDADDLAAMGLPRTSQKVLIPIPEMKDNEVYAPGYTQGERLVLIRHPHGGIFEIPELIVNNNQPRARKLLGPQAVDAIGINARVAEQLSGADFDGDTVLTIPNNDGLVKRAVDVKKSRPLQSLREFQPRIQYQGYEGMKVMRNTQNEMGQISNLITDMTIRGAPIEDIVRAVKHSMVVIDAEKHKLDYRTSYENNGIAALKKEYQVKGSGILETTRASTLVSRAKAPLRVDAKKPRPAALGGAIDPKTGEKKFVPNERMAYQKTEIDPKTGEEKTVTKYRTVKSTPMREVRDARALMSTPTGTRIERVYADHANELKAMANRSRLEMINTPNLQKSKSAAKTYAAETASLKNKLKVAQSNAPLERQAQVVAGAKVKARIEANPGMTPKQVKRARSQELTAARDNIGALKKKIDLTPREWEAIQGGAIAHTPLLEILNNVDPRKLRDYALPRDMKVLQGPSLSRARGMVDRGYTQEEIAEALGVSLSVVEDFLLKNRK